MTDINPDDHVDDVVDQTIQSCVDLANPKSFFLYAGAGSGKTRSLVDLIRHVCRQQGRLLELSGQRIGVITYTNAACDEIKQRLEFDPRVEVCTIHSFAWSLISNHDDDIRKWVSGNLKAEIAELEDQQARGRPNTKAAIDRANQIESKHRRYAELPGIRRFVYSPTGDNRARGSLNHSEVIAMTADFLLHKQGLQRLLVSRYPVLLIDESQDTNGHLMDALLSVQAKYKLTFCLGLFGDTMQRIYSDGKVGLATAIPHDWARPAKKMNHRCPLRVIELINKIRSEDDGQIQRERSDKPTGCVRLFVLRIDVTDRFAVEARIRARMAEVTGDRSWADGGDAIKTLTLEHHMAARRFGFDTFFEALYRADRLRMGLLDGTLPGIAFFTENILPLMHAVMDGDKFRTAAIVRTRSPLLDPERLEAAGTDQTALLRAAKNACDSLHALCAADKPPSLLSVLRNVSDSGLFSVPESLSPFVKAIDFGLSGDTDEAGDATSEMGAWRRALDTTLDNVEKYDRYIRGASQFDTHQGIKGLEFPRVMVIISDDEARGFMFSYDKLFGVKEKSETDLKNEEAGRETTMERTRRLFYVACSRAQQSLAVVHYCSRPDLVKDSVVSRGWFHASEVEMLI